MSGATHEKNECAAEVDKMWQQSCALVRVLASSVRVAETAGNVIKSIASGSDLKIVDKGTDGTRDVQTLADRSAQYCIETSLQRKFENGLTIIGEEDTTDAVPNVELGVCDDALRLNAQCPAELREAKLDELVVWVDPLDGTSEFAEAAKTSSPLLCQTTVLIGIAFKGRAVAGVIHQPFVGERGRTIWALDGVGVRGIEVPKEKEHRLIVTTRSHLTTLVQSALDALEAQKLSSSVERCGGAGYKVLRCLEDAAAYVYASGGTKKWDTAAPEAVIRAAGGDLTDLSGRRLYYGADAQRQNTGGVLASAPWIKHKDYIAAIPEDAKSKLPEFSAKV